MSRSRMIAGIQALRDSGDTETFKGFDPTDRSMPLVSDDHEIAAVIDGTTWIAQKLDAMRAHATQITDDGPFFAGAAVLGDSMWSEEAYLFVFGVSFPPSDQPADDLFAGLD